MADRRHDDRGFAMMAVVMGVGAIIFLVVLIFQSAMREYSGAQHVRRDDTLISGAEAMLERYAAKLTINPLYHLRWVDETELPRRCDQPSSTNYRQVVQPGSAWFDACDRWTYEPGADYYLHPLLAGRDDIDTDDIGVAMTVAPPISGQSGVDVSIVARQETFGQARAVRATIRPEAISEFAFLVEQELRFGSGAVIRGKIYVGQDLDFAQTPVRGVVHRNVYAEGRIGRLSGYGPPVFADGSRGFDSTGSYDDVREAYPIPLAFNNFWSDLELIRQVACGGGGLCVSRAGMGLSTTPTAWRLDPFVSGSQARVTVSAAYSTTTTSCLTAEQWWFVNSHTATWTTVGTFTVPSSGVIWVEGHTVIGRPGTTAEIGVPMTIYAGSVGSPKNVVIATDIVYRTGTTGGDVLGLIASKEVFINPAAVGSDNAMTVNAAILAQGGAFHVARTCGSSGSVILPVSGGVPTATLTTNGSMAIRHTGDVAAHFGTRNYGFDLRLEGLRPPLFPLLGDTWSYGGWQETHLPDWASG